MINNVTNINLDYSCSAGSLLGTTGTREIIDELNTSLGLNSSFFGGVEDIFRTQRSALLDNTLNPILRANQVVEVATNKLFNNDVIRPIVCEDDLLNIPPCMHLAILTMPRVKSLLEEERIDGFGVDPKLLPDDDMYGRLISNGRVDDLLDSMDKNGEVIFHWDFYEGDVELTEEELDYIEESRKYINNLLDKTIYDPTCFPISRS